MKMPCAICCLTLMGGAVIDPELRKTVQEQRIILTTWRELKERRDKASGRKH